MNIEKQNELVLVIEEPMMLGFKGLFTDKYPQVIETHGISQEEHDLIWLKHCVSQSNFQPRGIVEEDPYYKQIIPYVVFKRGGKIFSYSREGAESRLTGKISIGIGGHINLGDIIGGMPNIIEKAANREVREEIDYARLLRSESSFLSYKLNKASGIIYAGNSEDIVNSVHLGVLYIVNFDSFNNVEIVLTDEGKQLAWMTKEELLNCEGELELWSKMVLEECL